MSGSPLDGVAIGRSTRVTLVPSLVEERSDASAALDPKVRTTAAKTRVTRSLLRRTIMRCSASTPV